MILHRFALQFAQSSVLMMTFAGPRIAVTDPPAMPTIVILSEVSVPGTKIYLGSLLTPESRIVLPEPGRLDKVLLATSPAPGQTKVLEGREVSSRLGEFGITAEHYGIRVPDRIRIERDTQTLTPGDIAARVESEFLPRLSWEDVRLEEIGIFEKIVLPAGSLELTFQQSPNTDVARPFYLNINFRVDGQIVKRSYVRTVLAISHTVAVADNNLDPSGRIASDDVRWEKRRLSSTLRIPVVRPDFFENRRPRIRIAAGQIMTEDMFIVVPLIKRGDNVVLVFEDARIHVATQGVSLASGSKGDRIRVMNFTSRKELTAEIVDERTVRVIF